MRVDALRLRGPAIETIKLEAELDATDQLEFPNQYPLAVQYGLQPQLAQLEMLVNPDRRDAAWPTTAWPTPARSKSFRWNSRSRCLSGARAAWFRCGSPISPSPKRPSIPTLNPIRAKVSLGMRVLNVDDLGFEHPGGRMFMTYLTNKEQLAAQAAIGRAHRSRTGRFAMNYPLQALMQLGVVPPVTFPDRQPLLRLRHAVITPRPAGRCITYLARRIRAAAGRAELRHRRAAHGARRATGSISSPRNISAIR